MKRVLVIVTAFLTLAAGAQGAGRRPLLAVLGNPPSARLAFVDAVSLEPVGRTVELGRYGWPSARSPDGSRLVLAAQQPAGLRLVDLHRMRAVGALSLRGHSDVEALAWVSSRRVLVAGSHFVEGVDPQARRVLWTRTWPQSYEGVERSAHGLVFLVPSATGIGPTTLVYVDANGEARSVLLDRIQSGFHQDDRDDAFIGEGRRPGLAIDMAGNRAFVVGAGDPLAEVDLGAMSVAYHGGPRALAKALRGPTRTARWLGNGFIAVTGEDSRAWIDAQGHEQEIDTPAGLTLVDTGDWTSRRIDSTSAGVAVGDGLMLGYSWSWDSTTGKASGTGLVGYALEGTRRFHVLQGALGLVQVGSGIGYAWPSADTADGRVSLVDLATGHLLRTGTVPSPVFLLATS